MPTKFLIVAVTVNAVLGQLLIKRAIVALGGRSALANFPKFALETAVSPLVYASLVIQILGYVLWMVLISREKLGVASASVGERRRRLLHLDAALRMGRIRRVTDCLAMVWHQLDCCRRNLCELGSGRQLGDLRC